MATVLFTNLTFEQAKMLAEWYEGQGEQNADIWFDCNKVSTPFVNKIEVHGDSIIVECKSV